MRLVHAAEVLIGAEQDNLIINSSICFGALKTLNRVVKGCICWVNTERLVRHNLGGLPATIVKVKVDFEHVISRDGSERVDMVFVRFFLKLLSLNDLQVIGEEGLFHDCEAGARLLHETSKSGSSPMSSVEQWCHHGAPGDARIELWKIYD